MGPYGVGRFLSRSVALLSLVVLLLLMVPAALALERPRPGELARLEQQGKLDEALAHAKALGNYRLDPALLQYAVSKAQRAELGLPPVLTPPGRWAGMPTTGSVKILTLLIDFSDYPHYNRAATINAKLFGGGANAADFPYESLHNYYVRSSYNQLDLSGNVLGWYRPAYTRASLGSLSDAARETLIAEALNYYNTQGHDFAQYDNNNDGKIDYFVVVWTGPDQGWSSIWWGYQTSWYYTTSPTLDGKTLAKYSWQWECRYNGGTTDGVYDQVVVMHETGHALGLPDYYDYDPDVGPDGGVGEMDMMDANWGDHNSFSKWVLDWITPQVVTGAPQSVTLTSSGTTNQALVVMPGASSSNPFAEYFVVENRERNGNNSDRASNPNYNLPNDGLLVWHVDARLQSTQYGDDYISNNSYTAHKLLRLMEADGLNEIETVPDYWVHASDYYTSGKTFTDTSNPNSKKYDGTASNVVVRDIPAAGASMTFTAGVGGAAPPPGTDLKAPVTTVSGNDDLWHNRDVRVDLTATDEAGGSGVASIFGSFDGGATWSEVPGDSAVATISASSDHSNDGVTTLSYYASDMANNRETAKTLSVNIDTKGPTCAAKRASVRHGAKTRLYFAVRDTLSPQATCRLRITTRSGATKKSWAWGYDKVRSPGSWWYVNYRCKLRAGSYFIVVTGQDLAGNAASVTGRARLIVK